MAQDQPTGIGSVVADVRDISTGRDKVTVRAVMKELGAASHAGLLVMPALIAATPLSGIPGVTAVCGLMIALISAQMLAARDHLWLPGWILRRRVDAEDLRKALDRAQPAIRFLDGHSRPRLRGFVTRPGVGAVKVLCLLCGLAMPFLEVVPFTGSLMAGVVLFLGIALLTRDGLFAVIAIGLLAVLGGVLISVL